MLTIHFVEHLNNTKHPYSIYLNSAFLIHMTFEQKYPFTFQFFASYFPEADLDGLTDQEVVHQFTQQNPPEVIQQTLDELHLLINDNSSWPEALSTANRYFPNNSEIQSWLEMIKNQLIERTS
ncbi:hypothetical protein LVD15_23305 [Fulvivirga maritima]|uniref:contact-dependent growth inhibition system immunity protein n=1 Tax=Fulvivirga maritima TaxID=2904247 RepID=UPI001F1BFE66|nr:contact-dependent growth inhibition system immunity protein [Fulvivirga maritima]UII26197.1 hypothetical protein LVD15_23305 [Fulvivirga maritima]